jgi:hypothetical protein
VTKRLGEGATVQEDSLLSDVQELLGEMAKTAYSMGGVAALLLLVAILLTVGWKRSVSNATALDRIKSEKLLASQNNEKELKERVAWLEGQQHTLRDVLQMNPAAAAADLTDASGFLQGLGARRRATSTRVGVMDSDEDATLELTAMGNSNRPDELPSFSVLDTSYKALVKQQQKGNGV